MSISTSSLAKSSLQTPVNQTPVKATDVSVEEWRDYRYSCPVEATLDVIGGRWKGAILFHLFEGTLRFSDFGRLFPALSKRSLTTQLRELERDGVIHREVFAQVPPRVEYSLTARGQSLEPILRAMSRWGEHFTGPARCFSSRDAALSADEMRNGEPEDSGACSAVSSKRVGDQF